MRRLVLPLVCLALFLPKRGSAQPLEPVERVPQAAAQSDGWQFENEPMSLLGLIYYPTRETRFFDPLVMTRVGIYRSVPIYSDVARQPYGVVYVPIGRGLMRAYRTDSRGGNSAAASWQPTGSGQAVGTGGAAVPTPVPTSAPASVVTPTHVESIPPPAGDVNGVWLEYDGARWYSDGPAAVFSSRRFVRAGEYRGFAVYREIGVDRSGTSGASSRDIWVEVVKGGPVAPYTKR